MMTRHLESLLASAAATRRITESWETIDLHDGVGIERHFTHDASLTFGEATFVGHDAIVSVYAKRRARGARTARHLVTNLLVDAAAGPGQLSVRYALVLYAADGVPVQPSAPPTGIFDVADELAERDGEYLLRARRLTTVFRLEGAHIPVPFEASDPRAHPSSGDTGRSMTKGN